MERTFDHNKKGQLYADLSGQAKTEEDRQKLYAFLDRISEKQAVKLFEKYDYRVPFDVVNGDKF